MNNTVFSVVEIDEVGQRVNQRLFTSYDKALSFVENEQRAWPSLAIDYAIEEMEIE
jgi:hypothetical protein